ncbi:MAG: LemA family protein [Crocinitomicaceae bacterium]|nr:LemA family protein [Crocinitomicaceae bacterium]
MDYNEEKFKEHIKAVVEASQSTDDTLEERPLTLKELKELAISMGLTEEQWNDLQTKAHEHLKAADDHLKARNFREAITEAEKATAINPYIENSNAVLAKAYMMLWLQTHEDLHRDKAEFHARRELKVDPRDQIAVNVLSTIDKKRRILAGDSNNRKRLLIIVGVVIVAIILAVILFNRASAKKEDDLQTTQLTQENQFIKDQLIEAEEEVISKWDMVQIQIDRRNNLVPDLLSVIGSSDEDATALNESIENLKAEIAQAEGERKFKLMNDLDAKVQEMKEIANQNPNSENVKTLMVQIEGSENRIAYEKKLYNDAVKEYNILVKKHGEKFPEYEIKPYWSSN